MSSLFLVVVVEKGNKVVYAVLEGLFVKVKTVVVESGHKTDAQKCENSRPFLLIESEVLAGHVGHLALFEYGARSFDDLLVILIELGIVHDCGIAFGGFDYSSAAELLVVFGAYLLEPSEKEIEYTVVKGSERSCGDSLIGNNVAYNTAVYRAEAEKA